MVRRLIVVVALTLLAGLVFVRATSTNPPPSNRQSAPLEQQQATVTKAEAKAFWKEFDDHTLRHVGRFVGPMYGPGDPGKKKVWDDISATTGVGHEWIKLQITEANGKAPLAADKKAVADGIKKLCNDKVIERLSSFQLEIMKAHFKKKDGSVDYAKLQLATEMFANGELRPNAEMNQLFQWFQWKKYAEMAMECNVAKSDWERMLKILHKGTDIYRRVYPAPAGANKNFFGELIGSDANRFDPTKQLDEAGKKKLRDQIDPMTTAEVLSWEKMLLDDSTTALVPFERTLKFANISVQESETTIAISVTMTLTEPVVEPPPPETRPSPPHGRTLFRSADERPVPDESIVLHAAEIGLTLPATAYTFFTKLSAAGDGSYSAQFVVPKANLGLSLFALDERSQAHSVTTLTFMKPGPPPPRCRARKATVGTAAGETLLGTRFADVVVAGAGCDLVKTGDGDDVVCGGRGPDRLGGERGNDILLGEAGDDVLDGGAGVDLCRQGAGKGRRIACER